MDLQLLETTRGTKCAPPYPCQTATYLEEIKIFINKLLRYLNKSQFKLIMELLKHYMNNGFVFGF